MGAQIRLISHDDMSCDSTRQTEGRSHVSVDQGTEGGGLRSASNSDDLWREPLLATLSKVIPRVPGLFRRGRREVVARCGPPLL